MLPCIFGLSGPKLTADERAFFREADPAGFILFRRNCEEPAQLRALTDELRALAGREELPILIDQEGGRCARLAPPHWPEFPAPARFGALYERAPISAMQAARVNGVALGLVLRETGINVNCVPSLDLGLSGAHPVIGDRAFGADPFQVAALGRMLLEGMAEGGVAGVIKHLPGHGRAGLDSHQALPVVDADEEALEQDLLPSMRLAPRAPFAMTAHILYTAWDGERPATLSRMIVQDIIRGRISFDGLLISDDIVMEALAGPLEARASAALAAGCDLVLYGPGDLAGAERIARALAPVGGDMQARLAEAVPPAPTAPAHLADLLAKRDALLSFLS